MLSDTWAGKSRLRRICQDEVKENWRKGNLSEGDSSAAVFQATDLQLWLEATEEILPVCFSYLPLAGFPKWGIWGEERGWGVLYFWKGNGVDRWHGLDVIDTGWVSPCCPCGCTLSLINHGASASCPDSCQPGACHHTILSLHASILTLNLAKVIGKLEICAPPETRLTSDT